MKKGFVLTMLLISAIDAMACTGVLVGRNVSQDGSMLMARNEDFGSGANPKTFFVIKRKVNSKKAIFKNPDTGFSIEMPHKTLKYTILPDAGQDAGVFGEAGFNELGVCTSTTLSANANDEILKFDPYVKGGITEPDMASLILMQAKNARQGIQIIANIIDKKGAGEGDIIYVADKNDIWYMEIYTGHQYAAVRVPQDKYAVIPNAFMLGNIDLNSKDTIYSKDLINLAKKNNLLKEKDGKFHLAMTYRDKLNNYNQIRVYEGQRRFNPTDKVKYNVNDTYELFRTPERKIGLKDVMNVLRDRYDGTEFTDIKVYRPIGIDRNLESHIFQIKKNIPSKIGGIMWLAMGTVEHSPYLPYFGNISQTNKTLRVRTQVANNKSYYWTFKLLNTLGKSDRKNVGNGIKEYWNNYEDGVIKDEKNVEKKLLYIYRTKGSKAASDYSTKYSNDLVNKTLNIARDMQAKVITHVDKKAEGKPYKAPFSYVDKK